MNEIEQLRDRVKVLEQQVGELRAAAANVNGPGWKRNIGLFANDPVFAEIVKLGAQIRKADRPAGSKQSVRPKRRKASASKVVHSAKRIG